MTTHDDPELTESAHNHYEAGVAAIDDYDYDTAQEHLDRALALFGALGDSMGEAGAQLELGRLARRRGDLDAAEGHYLKALAMSERVGDQLGVANCRRALGNLARRRGDLDAAEGHYLKALAMSERVGDQLGVANCRRALGNLARRRGDLDAAEGHYLKALAMSERVGDQLGQANTILKLGELARFRGEYDSAFGHLVKALALYEAISDKLGEANTHRDLGRLAILRGAYDIAGEHLCGALTLYETLGDLSDGASVASELAMVLLTQGDVVGAVDVSLAGVRAAERLRANQAVGAERGWWREELTDTYGTALEVLTEAAGAGVGVGWAGLEVLEAARGDLLGGLLAANVPVDVDPQIAGLLERIDRLRAQMTTELDEPDIDPTSRGQVRSGEDVREASEALELELDGAVRELEVLVGGFALRYAPRPLEPDEVAGLVPDGVAVMAYHVNLEGPAGWVVSVLPSEEPVIEPLSNVAEILLGVAELTDPKRAHLFNSWVGSPVLELLSAGLLPQRVQTWLAERSVDVPARLLVVPTGVLWSVPWAALPIGGQPLCVYGSVSLTPSLRTLPPPDRSHGAGLLGFRDIDLPGTETEETMLRDLWHTGGFHTDPPEWRLHLTRDHQVAYVGCHGDASPGLGHRLHLTSGDTVITAAGLLTHTLPTVIHMGACTSGRVDPDAPEPVGLATVALTRGARHIIATTSPIPDTPTGLFTAQIHRYLQAGVHPAEALRRTQHDHQDLPLNRWATHIHIGNPTT